MEIIPWNPLQHPLLSTTVTPPQHNRWRWIFERSFYTFWNNTDLILTQIQRWIWEKQLIKSKSRGFTTITCYTQLHSILHFFITFPWTPSHTRTNNLSHTSFSSSFSFLHIHTMFFFLVSLHDLLWVCSPCPMKALKSFCTNQWPPHPSRPMRIWEWMAIQLKLGWESLGPMKHKRYSILQSKRMTILMTNGIGGSNLPLILDILMRSLELDPLPSVDPHILLLHPNYFK